MKETLFANALRRVSQVGLVLAILSSARAATPVTPIPTLPARPWVIDAGGDARSGTLPADVPLRGIPISWRWPELGPARGQFKFEATVRRPLEQIRDRLAPDGDLPGDAELAKFPAHARASALSHRRCQQ